MAKRISQTNHNKIVKTLAEHLIAQNCSNIRADIEGYPSPLKITWTATGNGHIPDVTTENGKPQIFEVETEDSIGDNHTEDQWKIFSAHANSNNGVFTVVVPIGCSQAAKTRLVQLNLKAEVWEV